MSLDQRCYYCRRSGGKHDEACPEIHPDRKAAESLFSTGWAHGRQRKKMEPMLGKHPTYRMGYGNGEVAAEEAENTYSHY